MDPEHTQVFSLDPVEGCFGFLDGDRAVTSLLIFGLPAGFLGNAGYIICLMFFSPVIVSSMFLLEPLIAQCFGWAMGIDEAPGWFTWIGTLLVLVGILLVQRADSSRNQRKLTIVTNK